MKQANIVINLYSFDELSEKAQQNAIEEHRRFLLNVMAPEDFISGDPEYDTPGELNAAYESEYEYYLMNDEPIIESIEINDYLFFENGDFANCTTFCGKHEKAGETVLNMFGKEYSVKEYIEESED